MRMILTDLDHTLLRQDGSLSEETLRILEKCRANGYKLAIATARFRMGAEPYIRQLKPDYEITASGALVHAGGRCVRAWSFTEAVTAGIIRGILAAAPEAEIAVACGNALYRNSLPIAGSDRWRMAISCDFTPPPRIRANKVAARLPDETAARRIAAEAGCQMERYRGEDWCSFLPEGVGKAAAIRALCDDAGISPEDIIAFGDDAGDLDMLRMCGKGVAVANAVPEVLAAADEITLSNDQDGVALWLNSRCLYRSFLASTYNTRDLGGHPTAAGKTAVRNRIWRSDAPTARNDEDIRLLKHLRITTILDLRTDRETAQRPCALAEAEGFVYRHLPIWTGSVPPDTLEAVPVSYLEIAASDEAAEALRAIAEAETGVLFCCSAGKDRTGVLTALLLLACGVDHETIVSDYAVSREYNRIRLEQFLAAHPEVDRQVVLANEISMERFIRLFFDRYGSVENYFRQKKLPTHVLAGIRGKLLDPR